MKKVLFHLLPCLLLSAGFVTDDANPALQHSQSISYFLRLFRRPRYRRFIHRQRHAHRQCEKFGMEAGHLGTGAARPQRESFKTVVFTLLRLPFQHVLRVPFALLRSMENFYHPGAELLAN